MKMKRRLFVKGLVALGILPAIPLAQSKEIAVQPAQLKPEGSVISYDDTVQSPEAKLMQEGLNEIFKKEYANYQPNFSEVFK